MQFNFKSSNTQSKTDNNQLLVTLNDLMDDMEFETNAYSDMYQERGEIYDKEKLSWNLNGNSGGRYTDKYIHAIMKSEGLEKLRVKKEDDKIERKNKNGK